jgi:flagellar motility protein MotE (MotC chaperone)
MKKILIVIQVVILVLILAKVASVVGLVKVSDAQQEVSLIANPALAQQPAATPAAAASSAVTYGQQAKETAEDNLAGQRDLAAALQAKKIELDGRENNLRTEEQRLLTLRKEITDKIALLKSQEEKLATLIEAGQTSDTKRYKEMAKVYEATPAAKAGSMLEKLDIKTAAGITMNMKKDKAGAIWGYISPQKAVEITKEITRAAGRQQAE